VRIRQATTAAKPVGSDGFGGGGLAADVQGVAFASLDRLMLDTGRRGLLAVALRWHTVTHAGWLAWVTVVQLRAAADGVAARRVAGTCPAVGRSAGAGEAR
jgi:hypothetical protein